MMMQRFYLWLNAGFYLLFSVLCTVRAESTASFLGLGFSNLSGKIEYITVYGGLEFGLAIFYAYSAFSKDRIQPALVFSQFLYGGLVLFRLPSLLYFQHAGTHILSIAALELVLMISAFGVSRCPFCQPMKSDSVQIKPST